MHVSGGNVTIRKSEALRHGGSGGVGRFLGPGIGNEGSPPRSGTQSVVGSAVLGRRVLRVQGLRGLQANAAPAVMQQVIFLKNQGFPCPSRLSHSIVVKGYIFPESIAKGSSVRSPLENYIGSSTQSRHTEHSTQSEVHQGEVHQSEVHLENYIGSSTRSQHTEHSTQSEVHQSEVHLENYIGSSTQSQPTEHSTQSEVHQSEVHRVK